ncbi:hypothetical protein ANAPRD1_01269 [Anaplasma phagocytophilum]|nr:hypothetical protein ANAPC2_00329 [Anaplasma phagocytophilum]SBO30956.1 hypothetical protein ANAPC3_00363 [Anaplasma phagocytophilum]SBO31021.1 hypothetical protein ANAPC4_00365 [Anaplasma phagocytophilum]SCV62297.1 hypothetical protein ANAPC5_00214 [Anaplasma phagocytophilum]SCV66752.1 hypothetical protein ANAPRD1_01269 [Anaplasma phagocytophilum]
MRLMNSDHRVQSSVRRGQANRDAVRRIVHVFLDHCRRWRLRIKDEGVKNITGL